MPPQSNPKISPASYSARAFDPSILREYDIRGQIGKTLGEDDAYTLGRAFGTYLMRDNHAGAVCVGYDGRLSSPALAQALIAGLNACGIETWHVGLGPTPMLYFAVKDRKAAAGIMVTGSHNPPDYNGFKMMLQNGPVFGDKIQQIGKIAAAGDFKTGNGNNQDLDIQDSYVDRLLKDFVPTPKADAMKIAWDAGHGAAGNILQKLTARLPGQHILLYERIDGHFPAHHPDPTVDKNLIDLQKIVREKKCDFGIAFDGDGDRIGVVDENGTILRCDILMTIYAREVLAQNPGAAIIGDVKCSQVMFDEITRLGGQAVMWKTGHSLIKDKMAELKAPLAGELSGHIFFNDHYYGFDDALYCAIRLINDVLAAGGKLSTMTAALPTLFNTPELRIDVEEEKKFGIVPALIANLRPNLPPGFSIDDIDGIRVSGPEGWWLLRPSNTQAALVFRAESDSEDGLQILKNMALQEVEKLGYSLNFDA